MNNVQIGRKGEQLAMIYLKQAGYSIVTTNYRNKIGEIDIIARDKDIYVFFEVKTRTSMLYGRPAEAVNADKQQKIIHTALFYLQQTHNLEEDCRFDVIEVLLSNNKGTQINHIKSAFSLN